MSEKAEKGNGGIETETEKRASNAVSAAGSGTKTGVFAEDAGKQNE